MRKLPESLLREVLDFIEFLLSKYGSAEERVEKKKFKFDWEGELADVSTKFSSIELQHKAREWKLSANGERMSE